jgi:uncharacterized membrane protein
MSLRVDGKARFSAELIAIAGVAFLAGCSGSGEDAKRDSGKVDGVARSGITETEIQAKADALLASLGAPANAEQQAAFQGAFEAVGAEPDWTLTVTPDFVSFLRPGLDEVTALPASRDVRAEGVYMVAGPLTIALQETACAYGDAANYPLTARILFEGVVYEGCARTGQGAQAGSRGWAELIHQYLPAIDRCLQRVTAKPGRVTIAYVNEDAQTVVRLLENDGGREECVVSADGSEILSVDPLSDRSVFDGERDPLFTRAPSQPPAGYTSETVETLDGEIVGYLSRKSLAASPK